ncbi:MAG: 50S ribosomal protein L9 [Dehalococcoidia bacterium]|nr:50S ribosomal protein L9 [Dehalococcoidia bacterium]
MKVVFLEEVEGTARAGDVKNVANGFARNYLLPRRLAAPATEHYIAIAQAKAGKEARRQERVDEDARKYLLAKIDGASVRIEVRVGEQDKLFGSVTARDVAEALQEATKVELEHRQIDLKQPIRELGPHEVTVKLTRNVHATVTVTVEALGDAATEEAAAETAAETVETSAEAPEETVEALEEAPEAAAAQEAESAPQAETAAEESGEQETSTETEG